MFLDRNVYFKVKSKYDDRDMELKRYYPSRKQDDECRSFSNLKVA